MKNKYIQWAIALFIVLLGVCMYAEDVYSDEGTVYIGLGKSAVNMHTTVAEVGYRTTDKWDSQFMIIGKGYTRHTKQVDHIYIGSFSRVIAPKWGLRYVKPYMRLGVAVFTESNLVSGVGSFRLGAGINFGKFELEAQHYSTAGLSSRNTGMDSIILRAKF